MHRQRLHADGTAAAARVFPGPSLQAIKPGPTRQAAQAFDIEGELHRLQSAAQAHRKPLHREAALLALATVACFLIPASTARLLLNVQDWAFLATLAFLVTWLVVRLRHYQRAVGGHFDQGLARINQAVADPSDRLVYRSRVARLRAEWLAPRKFFETGASLFVALGLYAVSLLVVHVGGFVR